MGNVPCVAKDKGDEVNDLRILTGQLRTENDKLKTALKAVGSADDIAGMCAGPDPGCLWLNVILSELWPKISAFVTNMVMETVQPQIQAALPKPFASGFYFEKVTLGDAPLQFASITAAPEDYMGRHGTTRDVALKFDTVYRGDAKVALSVAGAKVGIQNILLEGMLTIVLKELLDKPPFFGGVSVYFSNAPSIKMEWVGITGVLGVGPIKRTIRDIVRQQVSNICVLPKRIAVVLDKSEASCLFRIKAPRPAGCIHLKIIGARNLEGKDWNMFGKMTSDPFVQVRCGSQSFTSKTASKTCDPTWGEEVTFCIYDKGQDIVMECFDSDFGKGDDTLGRLRLSVTELLDKCSKAPAWFPLGPDEDGDGEPTAKAQGDVQMQAEWLPVTLDQAKAKAITVAGERPQTLMFVGLYSLKVPPAVVGTAYTIDVSCNGVTHTVTKKTEAPPAEPGADEAETAAMKGKIEKLKSLKASDEDIAEILSIPVTALEEKEPSATKYTDVVTVEEPFLWLTDVPKETTVDIVVKEASGKEIGTFQVQAKSLLEEATCTKRENLYSGVVADKTTLKADVLAQVRVIGASGTLS